MTVKRKTREQLAAEIEELRGCLDRARNELKAATDCGRSLRADLDDVKQRLAIAEAENQRMRGYLERVQEDDVVREELVAIGPPDGEQHLTPKRKPTIFAPQMYSTHAADRGFVNEPYSRLEIREQKRPRHWVTY